MSRLVGMMRSKFLQDAATLQIAGGLNQISQAASSIAVALLLGAHGQGLFALAVALQALTFFLVNVGVVPATVSQIATASARGMDHKAAAWISFLAKAVVTLAVVTIAFGFFFLPFVADWWYEDRTVGYWAWWLCFQPICGLPRVIAAAAFQGTRRMMQLARVENGHEFVRFFLVAMGCLITGSAKGAVLGMLAAEVLGSILAVNIYWKARRDGGAPLPTIREILRWIPEVPLRRGMRLGVRVGLVKNMHMMVLSIWPRLAIGGFVGPEYVAYFHLAQQIIKVPMMLTMGISRTMLPALGELRGRGDVSRLNGLFLRVALTTGGLITLVILAVLALTPTLVGALFPPGYVEPVTHYASILAVGAAVFSFAVANEAFFIATNQVRLWLWLSGVGTVITVPVAAWMAVTIDTWGAAIGVSFIQTWVLVHFVCIGIYLSRAHDKAGPGEPAVAGALDGKATEV